MYSKKSILIAGCAPRGISYTIAQDLAKRGHLVFVGFSELCTLPKDVTAIANIKTLELDTTSAASVSSAATTVAAGLSENGFSGLDVLINDTGVGGSLPLLDVIMNTAGHIYDAKLSETMSMVRAFTGLLERRQGKVINMSSSGTIVTAPCMGKSTASSEISGN